MPDHVWASNFVLKSGNFGWYEPWFGDAVPEPERLERSGRIAQENLIGRPVPQGDYPCRTIATRNPRKGGAHLVVIENRNVLVSDAVAEILQRFDLGAGGTYPTQIVRRDRQRKLHDLGYRMHYWNIGNSKNTLLPERSQGIRTVDNPRFKVPVHYVDGKLAQDALALGRACLDGPDIWREGALNVDCFFSDRLVRALKSAKLATRFGFVRCRVI
jgi:hypothetical protein